VYVTGQTRSTDFPTASAWKGTHEGGNHDAFVAKLGPRGISLVYSTYVGGDGEDFGRAIAVDQAGNVYITGNTTSPDFPVLNPIQGSPGGSGRDAFLLKLNSTGSDRLWATYHGGSGYDSGNDLAVDAAGNIYLAGTTYSNDFPIEKPYQGSPGGGPNDVFLTKVNPAGSTLLYSTYLGGTGGEEGRGISVDGDGRMYVVGDTESTDFPTSSPVQGSPGGDIDAFVAAFEADGSRLTFATYLGGASLETGQDIQVDSDGNVYLVGSTRSGGFPEKHELQRCIGGGSYYGDAFLTKLAPRGTSILFSTCFGGNDDDIAYGVELDESGQSVYMAGETASTNLHAESPYQASPQGGVDAFVSRFSAHLDFFIAASGHGSTETMAGAVSPARDATHVIPTRTIPASGPHPHDSHKR
jgi:hypothetical protein